MTPAPNPRFPGFREMSAEEILADGDMAKYAWNLNLEPTRYLGMEVGEGGVGIYFRPLAKPEGDADALASSLVDVLSAENADLKAKLAALQNLYDDASEQDMLSVSREESLTAERDALLGALAKAREALELVDVDADGFLGDVREALDLINSPSIKALESPTLPNMDGGAK